MQKPSYIFFQFGRRCTATRTIKRVLIKYDSRECLRIQHSAHKSNGICVHMHCASSYGSCRNPEKHTYTHSKSTYRSILSFHSKRYRHFVYVCIPMPSIDLHAVTTTPYGYVWCNAQCFCIALHCFSHSHTVFRNISLSLWPRQSNNTIQ